eukprot:m.172394 g.172394  ORF g.172394 m.172394 type:complete len:50 (-) comp18286_c0_seq1:1202-1351(-)
MNTSVVPNSDSRNSCQKTEVLWLMCVILNGFIGIDLSVDCILCRNNFTN